MPSLAIFFSNLKQQKIAEKSKYVVFSVLKSTISRKDLNTWLNYFNFDKKQRWVIVIYIVNDVSNIDHLLNKLRTQRRKANWKLSFVG